MNRSASYKSSGKEYQGLSGGFNSLLMQDIIRKVEELAGLDDNVILAGEIGTGKKWLVRMLHQQSVRAAGPLHTFYCVDIDEAGYKDVFWERIEFEEDHIVLKYDAIEKASGGILFLDQFSELPPAFMIDIADSFVKGCRQLFRYNRAVSPRLILTMSQESYNRLHSTSVWDELLGRIDPVSILVPPLRERPEDIPLFIEHFLAEIREMHPRWKTVKISKKAWEACLHYHWPGNVRQLKNAILQGAVLSYGSVIEHHHMPFSMNWKLPYDTEKP